MRYSTTLLNNVSLAWPWTCNVYSIDPINMCTDFEINRYKIDEFRKYAKIVFYLTQKRYVVRHGDTSDRYFYQEYFETNQKYLPLPVRKLWLKQWFSCLRWPRPWSLTNVIFCHTHCAWCTGISMRSFIRIGPVLIGDTAADTHTNTNRRSF